MENNDIQIFEPPKERRYWIVKSDAGRYYENFRENGVIAIGHLNEFVTDIPDTDIFNPDSEDLKKIMEVKKDDKVYYNSNNYGQVNAFINEAKVGDWVITKGYGVVCIGRIESEVRLDRNAEVLVTNKDTEHEQTTKMNYMLKRSVSWGPVIKIDKLPIDIILSLKTPMTFFNIDRHMESILYTIYPFFRINDVLYLSIEINQIGDIRNFYITQVFEYLNELEFLSKIEDTNNISVEYLSEQYYEFAKNEHFNLSTKASFHSPGDIWAKLGFDGTVSATKNMTRAIIIYSMLFGNSHLGFDGLLDAESRQKIWEVLVKRIDIKVTKEAVSKLKLDMPSYDTKSLDSPQNKTSETIKN